MRSIGILAALTALAPAVTAQYVSPPTDLISKTGYAGINIRYKQVPNGICETRAHVKSYSGYVDIGKNQHIFFWFIEAREADPTTAPLTSWINGGPGSSSMIGLFQELGPCGVDHNGKLYDNPYAWNQKSNMIFIDQPQTVGLSYTKTTKAYLDENQNVIPLNGSSCPQNQTCGTFSVPDTSLVPDDTQGAAPGFWKTLQGFMGAFPQYSRNGFNFATESYGGHYGPVFNEYIEQQNKNLPKGAKEIHLESVLVGNGWYDPVIQYQAYYNFSVYPGNTYDYKPYNKSTQQLVYNNLYGKGNCMDQLANCKKTGDNTICSNADNYCANNVESIWDVVTNRDEYDSRELMTDPFPYNFYPAYLNTERVQKAIGAFTNFTDFSGTVGNAFGTTGDDGREDNTIEDVRDLVDKGIYFVSYVGDADYNCNWIGNRVIADKVNAPGYSSAGYAKIQTSDKKTHGEVRQSSNYAFVRVYLSGHEVPFYQPVLALEMFNRVICGLDIETGTKSVHGYKSTGPKESTYREGSSYIINHVLSPNATYNVNTGKPNE